MFFDQRIIFLNEEVDSSTEIITKLARKLESKKIVNKNFLQHVLNREAKFPTGLALNGLGVAMPHTDSDYVNKSQIAFATLESPISFKSMANLNEEVSVDLIFMIAMASPHEQTGLLSKLMGLFQDEKVLKELKESKNEENVIEILYDHKII
ncbi:PTS sugar transporter subunit IIA [Tetragenococcus halophilus]|uniref:PTS sugar transporter subunit IIA n=1 Tax=Tetragenococcus halophilus TaxID=51669 RepID=UPI000B9298EC|nr:PTS sugar transporter subunit IIA [Tetragenococcus halophilus]